MDELLTWLRQRLDEDEAAARRLPEGYRLYVCDDGCVERPDGQWADGSDHLPNHHNTWLLMYDRDQHLAEVEAKRAILAAYERADAVAEFPNLEGGIAEGLEIAVHLHAQASAGQPGWREEWRTDV